MEEGPMKLIIRQYLAGLRERNELDAVLPGLLSQMGLTVYSRPGRGTRQDGVDVGAVGSIDGGPEAIRSMTESRCSGERWLYRADMVIVLWPASS